MDKKSQEICQSCGGNGYTKTNPNCYKTCLQCLGRGNKIKTLLDY